MPSILIRIFVVWVMIAFFAVIHPDSPGHQANTAIDREPSSWYQAWLDEDVRWIISDEEAAGFKLLKNDIERERFVRSFWQRRDPTPDTWKNEFLEEHYRRILFAIRQFSTPGIPGWKSDRGRIYIMYGPPDSITPGSLKVQEKSFPLETWKYRYMEGLGPDVELRFVDECKCQRFEFSLDLEHKDMLLYVPSYETSAQRKRIEQAAAENLPYYLSDQKRTMRFPDLEALVKQKIRAKRRAEWDHQTLHLNVRTTLEKATTATQVASLTLEARNSELVFMHDRDHAEAKLDVLVVVTDLKGAVVLTVEDVWTVLLPESDVAKISSETSVMERLVPLRPGPYRADVVARDENSRKTGMRALGIRVPN